MIVSFCWIIGVLNLDIVCYLLFGAWDFFIQRLNYKSGGLFEIF